MTKFTILLIMLTMFSLACGMTTAPASIAPMSSTSDFQLESAKKQPQISTETPRGCYGIVTASKLNLRADADPQAKQDGAGLVNGDIVKIIGTLGDWYKIQTKDGREGYAKSDFISRPGCEQ